MCKESERKVYACLLGGTNGQDGEKDFYLVFLHLHFNTYLLSQTFIHSALTSYWKRLAVMSDDVRISFLFCRIIFDIMREWKSQENNERNCRNYSSFHMCTYSSHVYISANSIHYVPNLYTEKFPIP